MREGPKKGEIVLPDNPSVCCEYVSVSFINNKADLAYKANKA